jgi:hypothetical protein
LGCASPAWRNYFKNRNIGPNEIATDLFFQVLRAEAFGEQDVLDDVVDDEAAPSGADFMKPFRP